MATRHRERRRLRGAEELTPARRILVVCEGKLTEPRYLRAFTDERKSPTVKVETVGAAGDPVTLVEKATELRDKAAAEARRRRDSFLAYDEVWCCFDVDMFGARVPQARDAANARELKLAMTNPCFELWLILHLRDSPGARGHHDMQKVWRELQPDLDDKDINFAVLSPGYEDAVRRATKLLDDAASAEEPIRNPVTEVHLLTESIDAEGRERRRQARERQRVDTGRFRAEEAAAAALAQARAEGFEDDTDL